MLDVDARRRRWAEQQWLPTGLQRRIGELRTVGELAAALTAVCDAPEPEVVGGGRPGDVRHIVADPGRARTVLGFAAQIPFAAGIVDFVNVPMRAPVV